MKCKGLCSPLFREVLLPLSVQHSSVLSLLDGGPMNASSAGTSHPLTHPQRQAL